MPGPVPGIFVSLCAEVILHRKLRVSRRQWRSSASARQRELEPARPARCKRVFTRTCARNFFIIFVDGIFTTFIARLFTNTSNAISENPAISCV